ncbi:NERD domain-containing protein/DEAD/DEAH box helicase [Streptomyces sp. NBC_00893]|uniref:NERD domain-containing protein n=1 Tax=Streptomyces sp. NBC_00893 TaxID=2975862 RepID=UPI00225C2F85|nr:NERD domain-containing protein/DEAD/DEAH box helicase [Streptomyces sp. NBC_00893]MCX4847788.1 NERD domain-containing protein [Streptomyces sp. NBC_00893]
MTLLLRLRGELMRIVPSEISSKTRSAAERSVFAALKAIPDNESVALHSVHLPAHRYKRVGEIDFVVITHKLILFIEVKGGGVAFRDGKWHYGGGDGHVDTRDEGPFEQASSGMHELEREFRGAVDGLRARDAVAGYLVITPGVDLPPMTTYEPEQYLGRTAYAGGQGLEAAIRRAGRYWPSKGKNRSAISPISAQLRGDIVKAVRPDFDLVPNLQSRITDLEATFERLTNEQLERIDELEENPRLIWTGGAGTGKTFLAAEAARRKSATGTVLFTCASHTLAAHVSNILSDESIVVLPFDRLAETRGRSFDHLIVDEAQDLMRLEHLGRLEELVEGGLDRGRWIFMLDRNNQILSPEGYDPEAWKYLSELGATSASLKRNCRNTKQIVRQVQRYTGADLGTAMAGQGEQVTFAKVSSREDEASALDKHLDRLLDDGVSPRDITLVSSSGDWASTSARLSRRFSKIDRYADTIGSGRSRNRTTWSSVVDFKGLENQVVCLIDLDAEALEGRLDSIYVAWTRARAHLWIATLPGVSRVLRDMGTAALEREGATG